MSRRSSVTPVLTLLLLTAVGCGNEMKPSASATKSFEPPAPMMDRNMAPGAFRENAIMPARRANEQEPGAQPAGGGKPVAADEQAISRKIIYSAQLELQIRDVDETQKSVEKIIDDAKGYIAKSEVVGDTGSKRTATWTIKVPADKFRSTINQFTALGKPTRNSSDSQDVTEEFVDVTARVKNLKNEEEALNKLLKEAATRMEEFLKIRDQIKNIRGEIERAEGRLKYLATMSSMSSIILKVREEETYIPPTSTTAAAQTPSFGTQIETTFTRSWDGFMDWCKSIVLFVVSIAPWIPVILIGLLVVRFVIKVLIRFGNTPLTSRPVPLARPLHTDSTSTPTS